MAAVWMTSWSGELEWRAAGVSSGAGKLAGLRQVVWGSLGQGSGPGVRRTGEIKRLEAAPC